MIGSWCSVTFDHHGGDWAFRVSDHVGPGGGSPRCNRRLARKEVDSGRHVLGMAGSFRSGTDYRDTERSGVGFSSTNWTHNEDGFVEPRRYARGVLVHIAMGNQCSVCFLADSFSDHHLPDGAEAIALRASEIARDPHGVYACARRLCARGRSRWCRSP